MQGGLGGVTSPRQDCDAYGGKGGAGGGASYVTDHSTGTPLVVGAGGGGGGGGGNNPCSPGYGGGAAGHKGSDSFDCIGIQQSGTGGAADANSGGDGAEGGQPEFIGPGGGGGGGGGWTGGGNGGAGGSTDGGAGGGGGGNYAPGGSTGNTSDSPEVVVSWTVETPTNLSSVSGTGTFGGTATLSATLQSSGDPVANESVDFSIDGNPVGSALTDSNGIATLSSVSLAGIDAGTYSGAVGASFAGDSPYAGSTGSADLVVNQADQAITVTPQAPASAVYNMQFTVGASGGDSGQPISYSSSGVCTNSGATFTMTSGTGTCSVMYDQAGDGNYNAATQVVETVNASKADQAITVTNQAPPSAVFKTQFTVAATGGGSGNPVSYSSSGSCNHSGATFFMTSGSGTCSVKYDQAGNGDYNAATQVVETVNANRAPQAISVNTPAPASAGFNTHFTVAATAPGGAVSYSSAGVCTNSGATFTMTSASGACSVKYDQAGSSDYNAATQRVETVNASKADQAISVNTPAPGNAVFGSQFTVAATGGGSGNPISYSSNGVCTNNGATFTMTSGTGACSVMYDQAGDGNYNAATQVVETVNAVKADQTISVNNHAPLSAVYNTQFTVAATASSGLAVSYSHSGGCSNSGATFTMTSGTTTCTVMYDQAGDGNYNAATQVVETVNAVKADQTISVNNRAPVSAVLGSHFTVAATGGGSGNPISYSSNGVCSRSGATFTMTSASGTCTVKYDQAGDGNYNAAPELTETVNAIAAFGGFQAPPPKTTLTYKAGSNIAVKFTFTDASGHPLAASAAAALAAAGNVEVSLTGPDPSKTQLASAPCTWVTNGAFFQCNLKTPSGLTAKTPYSLTAQQKVGGLFVTAPPYNASLPADMNPETIFFK
jgi:hypothetical protein